MRQDKTSIKPEAKQRADAESRARARAFNAEWRKRIAEAKKRGRSRGNQSKRIYDAVIELEGGKTLGVVVRDVKDDAAAVAFLVERYGAKDIHKLQHIGYENS